MLMTKSQFEFYPLFVVLNDQWIGKNFFRNHFPLSVGGTLLFENGSSDKG